MVIFTLSRESLSNKLGQKMGSLPVYSKSLVEKIQL